RAASDEDIPRFAARLVALSRAAKFVGSELLELCRAIFNSVALTPYTQFENHFISLLEHLTETGFLTTEQLVDELGYMLRHLVRHLTAFDLIQFHNMGANFPDALMLESLLTAYLRQVERQTELFLSDDVMSAKPARQRRMRRR